MSMYVTRGSHEPVSFTITCSSHVIPAKVNVAPSSSNPINDVTASSCKGEE